METDRGGTIAQLLQACRDGDPQAIRSLFPILSRELHLAAKRLMSHQPPGHTLQTTALVNEAYLRLASAEQPNWVDRSHFIAACSQVMRRILVDHARAGKAQKRGGGDPLPLEEAWLAAVEPDTDVIALDHALDALALIDTRKAKVVEMRFFCGMSVEETAAALQVSEESVFRDWRLARAFLARQIKGG